MHPAGFQSAIPASERANLNLIPRGYCHRQFYVEKKNKFITAIVRTSIVVKGETPDREV
jgi:hypothetical protein